MKMAPSIVVRNHTRDSNGMKRFTVDNISMSDNVEILKREVASKIALEESQIELIYCGHCLTDGESLEGQNVKSGVTVHVLKKVSSPEKSVIPTPKPEPAEIQQLVLAVRTAVMNPNYREMVQRLSRPENLENILAVCPGLSEDPIALAVLQDPDLIAQFTQTNCINNIIEAHPLLVQAINHVAAAVHEEANSAASSSSQGMPPAYLYSLDALSDEDEEMESAHADPTDDSSMAQLGESTEMQFPMITQAQLASALAGAFGSVPGSQMRSSSADPQPSTSYASPSRPSTSSQPRQPPTPVISEALFSQAVQSALNGSTQAQLQQLRDMGISDDALSIRALEITGGDVMAALDFIFGEASEASSFNSRNNADD